MLDCKTPFSFDLDVNENGEIKIKHIFCVIDCGIVINTDIVKRQIQSAVIYGLTSALKGKIHFNKGQVVESNFHDYQALTMQETPPMTITIIESDEEPVGYGEPGLPPLAPALLSAVYAVTQKRFRSLPIKLNTLKSALKG